MGDNTSINRFKSPRFSFTIKPINSMGFTLLELLVVLIIISLMSVMVVPKLAGPLDNLKLKTSANKLAAVLRFARNQAATEKIIVSALFDYKNGRISIVSAPVKSSIDNIQSIDEAYDLPEGIKVESIDYNDSKKAGDNEFIRFFPSGGSSGGTITLVNEKGGRKKLDIDFITGGVKLLDE